MPSIPEISTVPPKLSDAFRSHPVHLRHECPDLTSLKELPDSYDWTDQHYVIPATNGDSAISESIPVIDLNDPNALQLIGHACKTWGAFQVINHGIPTSLLDQAECTTRHLFSLPVEQKLKASRSPDALTGYGLSRSNSFFSKIMWSEVFTIIGSPLDHFRHLWPEDYTKHCKVMEEYEKEMKKSAEKLMWLMLGSLNITMEDIEWADPKGNIPDEFAVLHMNYYPACPNPDRAMGMAAHSDSTILTILHQNNTAGLQVLKKGTGWVAVPTNPGGLVVIVGDLLQILSNGSYISALHRAVVNRDKPRFSLPYFYGPPARAQVSPLPKLVGPSDPPLYRPITWSEFLGIKAKHFNNALSSIRICTSPPNEVVAANGDNNTNSAEVA
ncbi:gibberellin 3-beta-dioxygenase 1-like [Pistacia vera]|uniref:gibberellin 3-beta-dioxygenase 1-like n=1 Tax=Pistacia vera TaxID=55513 RepID=UPI00126300B3|nr:gibberellin 3-beta-dioxygenase 1-like [Pistacia vera]